MAVDYNLVDRREPHLYKTTDFGATWTRISDGLPTGHPLDYTLSIAENPHRRGMLFAGTGHAFYYSLDDGQSWTQFKDKLPAAPVNWIEVPLNAPEVVVATYGRGVWILRDVTELELSDQVDQPAEVRLYEPLPATRLAGSTPVSVTYRLPAASTVTLDFLDSEGETVMTERVVSQAGFNTYSTDLRYPEPAQPVLRSIPPDNPHIWEAGRWETKERPVTHWGLGAARWRPLPVPGRYSVRLTANGRQLTQPLDVLRDPTLTSTDADLAEGTEFQRKVVGSIGEVVDKINRIEIMREQVENLRAEHAGDPGLDGALAGIYQRMYETELHFLSRTEMHSDDKWYVEKYRLYLNLVWLLAEVGGGGGDVAGGAAFRPTNAALEVYQDRLRELDAARIDFERLLEEIDSFNREHSEVLPPITSERLVS
jgi:hypothetical protein